MSWQTLKAIGNEVRQLAEQDASTLPTACWRDGEPLKRSPHGGLFCQACGWKPDDTTGGPRT